MLCLLVHGKGPCGNGRATPHTQKAFRNSNLQTQDAWVWMQYACMRHTQYGRSIILRHANKTAPRRLHNNKQHHTMLSHSGRHTGNAINLLLKPPCTKSGTTHNMPRTPARSKPQCATAQYACRLPGLAPVTMCMSTFQQQIRTYQHNCQQSHNINHHLASLIAGKPLRCAQALADAAKQHKTLPSSPIATDQAFGLHM
jgi:hypothetical protein